ncbi:MAG: MMPL family transporter [Candidatus Latescibacterota bacterium]
MNACFRWLASLAWHHSRAILLAATLLSAVSGYAVFLLVHNLETDFAALLPEGYPSVRTLEEIRRKVRGTENVQVVVESPDPAASQRFLDDLARLLEGEEYRQYVRYVDYRRDVDFFRRNALLYMDLEDLEKIEVRLADRIGQEKLERSPLFVGFEDEEDTGAPFDIADLEAKYGKYLRTEEYYSSPDHSMMLLTAVAAGSSSNVGFGRAMGAAVNRAVSELDPSSYHPRMAVSIGGSFRNKVEEYEIIRRDIILNVVSSFVLVVLLITAYFRQPLAVLFIMIPLVMGVAWSFAVAYLVIGSLNTITGFLFGVLFGLGIDFGVHLFSRYLEDRVAGMSIQVSLEKMLVGAGRAVLTAGVTTAAAFTTLTVTDFRGFSEFGFIAAVGIVASMLSMVTVLPACLVVADRGLHLVRMVPVWGHTRGAHRRRYPFAGVVLTVGMAAVFFLASRVPRVEFEYDFSNLRAVRPATRAVKAKIDTIKGEDQLSESPAVMLLDSQEDLDEAVAAVEAKIAAPDSTPTISAVRSLWSALPAQQEEKLAVIARIRQQVDGNYGLLGEQERARVDEVRPLLDVGPLDAGDLPASITRRFTDREGKPAHLAFIYPKVKLRDGRKAMAFAEDAAEIRTASGRLFHASSSNIIFADMLRLMLRDSRIAMTLTCLAVFLTVLLDFRSLKKALLVVIPLVCALVGMVGAMELLGMKLNFYNMVILPSIIGLGIDNGVHFYHRYQEEGPGSLPLVLLRTGGAMLMCVLTTMVGFAGLIMAQHPGLNSIGILAQIGLGASFVAAVTVLPALLQVLEGRAQRRAASGQEEQAAGRDAMAAN